jgi:trk system potassium uptake protein TrkA
MYIIIIGAGSIGEGLAHLLTERGNEVLVIEKKEKKCIELIRRYNIPVINGDGTDRSILLRAEPKKADALVSTTQDDAINLLAMIEGKELEIKSLISIVNQPEHIILFKRYGVNTIENPSLILAEYLYRLLQKPLLQDFMSIGDGKAEILELIISDTATVVGKSLEILKLAQRDIIVISIVRDDELILPKGNVIFKEGDRVIIFGKVYKIEEILQLFTKQKPTIS